MWHGRFKYDAFVSHAVEDKLAVANDLCDRLEKKGLKLWYSGKELKVGDSLDKAIENGLEQSRYGIVILSQMYLQKNWPRKEYYMLRAKEPERGKVILPVLYGITMEDLQKLDIHIADRWAVSIDKDIDMVVQKLVEEILGGVTRKRHSFLSKLLIPLLVIVTLIASYFAYSAFGTKETPPLDVVQQYIEHHIHDADLRAKQEQQSMTADLHFEPASMKDIVAAFTRFTDLKTNYRNEYLLSYNGSTIRSKKRVEEKLKLNLDALSPLNEYDLAYPNVFLVEKQNRHSVEEARYLIVNTQPVTYKIVDEFAQDDGEYVVIVSYGNFVKYFSVTLSFPTSKSAMKRRYESINAIVPTERYVFHKVSGAWVLRRIE